MVVEKRRSSKKSKSYIGDLPKETTIANDIRPAGSSAPVSVHPPAPDPESVSEPVADGEMEKGPCDQSTGDPPARADIAPRVLHGSEQSGEGAGVSGPGDDNGEGPGKSNGGGVVDMGHATVPSNGGPKREGSKNRKHDSKRRVVKKVYIIRGGGGRRGYRGKRPRVTDPESSSSSGDDTDSDSGSCSESDSDGTDSDSSQDSVVKRYTKKRRPSKKTQPKKKKRVVSKRQSKSEDSSDPGSGPESDGGGPERPAYRMPSFRFI